MIMPLMPFVQNNTFIGQHFHSDSKNDVSQKCVYADKMWTSLLDTFHHHCMSDHCFLWSARELSCFVDQGFFNGLRSIDDNYRPDAKEEAVDITVAFGQLGIEMK